jgi:hypothetical protein
MFPLPPSSERTHCKKVSREGHTTRRFPAHCPVSRARPEFNSCATIAATSHHCGTNRQSELRYPQTCVLRVWPCRPPMSVTEHWRGNLHTITTASASSGSCKAGRRTAVREVARRRACCLTSWTHGIAHVLWVTQQYGAKPSRRSDSTPFLPLSLSAVTERIVTFCYLL